MEQALVLRNMDFKDYIQYFDRIYIGSESCENLIPTMDEVRELIRLIGNKKLTILTPPVTNKGIRLLRQLFKEIIKEKIVTEVVFNDFGVLRMLMLEFNELKRGAGRLVSPYFFNQPQDLIEEYSIEYIELDQHLFRKNIVSIPAKISFYYPHAMRSVTKLCIFHKEKSYNSESTCNQECRMAKATVTNRLINEKFILSENTFLERVEDKNINRIEGITRYVFNPLVKEDFKIAKIIKKNYRKSINWYGSKKELSFDIPHEVILEITADCNFNCEGCFNKNNFAQKGRTIEPMSTSYIKEIIDSIVEAGIPKIRISGGEPLLRKDLLEIVEYAKSKNLLVWMNSNATLFTKEKAQELKPYVDNILVSLNGYDDETDGRWTCTKESFSKKIEGIKTLMENGIDIRCGTVATPDNINNLEKIHAVVNKLNIKQWEVYRPIYKELKELDIETLYRKLVTITLETGKWHPIANIIPLCIMNPKKLDILSNGGKYDDGHSRITVDPRGFAKPDYFSETNIGDPRDIMSCWNHPHMQKIRNLEYLPKECNNCIYKEKCKGGSRELSYALHGRYDQPDPLANFENKKIQ
jgi:radical SAM protein with 4Fe4S-binding SPASM domain